MTTPYRYGIVFALVVALAGCGQKELPVKKTYSVQGKVQLKGESVAFATVTFDPKGGKGSPATAYTDKDGVFSGARTYSNNEMDGMVPGEYDVKIQGYNPVASLEFLGKKPAKDEKVTKIPPEVEGKPIQTVTIEEGDDNQILIDIK